MKIISKAILTTMVVLSFLSLNSCKKDNTIMYNNTTMGNVVDGKYISDQGNIFNIVEQSCSGDITSMKRALTVCDILKKTDGGEDNEYDVRLNLIQSVLVKDIVALGTELNEEMKVEDAINIENIWISGGYLNLTVVFAYDSDKKTSHLINIIQEESSETGTYKLKLVHNAFEDKVTNENISRLNISGGYVSFPISSFITEDEAKLSISWKGFDLNNFNKTEEHKIDGAYKKSGFEQAPIATLSKRVAIR